MEMWEKAKDGKRREAESDIGLVKEQERERKNMENISRGHKGLTSSEMLLEVC